MGHSSEGAGSPQAEFAYGFDCKARRGTDFAKESGV